jgi:uncharacterized membrane protein
MPVHVCFSLVAIGAMITTLMSFALFLGFDGVLLASAFTALGIIAGYLVGKKLTPSKEPPKSS